jgi:hypothetical protein
MRHAGRHPAVAQNGPLFDQVGLTVASQDGQGRWPTPVVWSTGESERHVYELMALKVGRDLAPSPVYAFLGTLAVKESVPEVDWVPPPRYLM